MGDPRTTIPETGRLLVDLALAAGEGHGPGPVLDALASALAADHRVRAVRIVANGEPAAGALAFPLDDDGPAVLQVIVDAPLDDEDCAFLRMAAAIIGRARWTAEGQRRAGVRERLRIRRERMEAAAAAAVRGAILTDVSVLLSSGEGVENIFHCLPERLRSALVFDYVGLAVADGPGRVRVVQWGLGTPPGPIGHDAADIGWDQSLLQEEPICQFTPDDIDLPLAESFAAAGMTRAAVGTLRHHGETLGILHICRREPAPFTGEEVQFLGVLTTLFAQAIAAERRVAAAAAEARRNSLLNQLSILLNADDPGMGVFDEVQHLIREAIDVDWVTLLVSRPDEHRLELVSVYPEGAFDGARDVSYDEAALPDLERMPRRVVQYRVDNLTGRGRDELEALGIRRGASAALRDGRESCGLLSLGRRRVERFTDGEIEFIDVVGTLLAQAIANRLRHERTRHEVEDQATLAAIAAAAATESEPAALVVALNEQLVHRVPWLVVSFGFLVGDTIQYRGPDGSVVEHARDGYYDLADELGQVANLPWPADRVPAGSPLRGVPLSGSSLTASRLGGTVVGYLLTATLQPNYRFSDRELRLFRMIAQIIGPAMQNLRAADETERQRALYDLALQSLSEAVLLVNHDLQAVYANPRAQAVVDHFEAQGATHVDDILGMILPPAAATLRGVLDHHQRGRATLPIEVGGEDTWFDFEAIPLDHPEYRLLLVGSDATAKHQREAEERRHRSELDAAALQTEQDRALRNLVLDSLSEGVILLEEDLTVAYANAHGQRIVDQLSVDGRIGARTESLMPEDLTRAFLRALRGIPARLRSTIPGADRNRTYEVEFIPVPIAPWRLLIVANNVTKTVEREAEMQRQREQMEQTSRLAALGEIIGGVAHELNNPLTAVVGFAELMSLSSHAEPLREDLAVVQKEAARARDVVRDLLFIARPGTSARSLVSLRDVLAHIDRIRRGAWSQQGITAEVDSDGLTHLAHANEQQLTQVLLNLVTNAEYALSGRPGAHLQVCARDAGDQIEVVVRDNGRGMDDATRERVFEPFFTTKPGVGTGLGLSLSLSIVTAHDGQIEIETAPGVGTTFRVLLPAAQAAPAVAGPRLLVPAAPRRVLVIDDEPNVRRVCQRVIMKLGHDCVVADGARSALAVEDIEGFDLILCDYRLATETADIVVGSIAERQPEVLPRIVIATGATTDSGVLELTQRFNLRLLAKPYGIDQIEELMGRAS